MTTMTCLGKACVTLAKHFCFAWLGSLNDIVVTAWGALFFHCAKSSILDLLCDKSPDLKSCVLNCEGCRTGQELGNVDVLKSHNVRS